MKTKILSIITTVLIAVVFVGCTQQYEAANKQAERVIGTTSKYEVIQVNDSIVICVPRENADKSQLTMVFNLKNVR